MARARTRRAPGWRPQPSWGGTTDASFITVNAATSILVATLIASTAAPETVRRTRGVLGWKSDQNAASEDPVGAFGICVVSEPAATAGVASVPTPFTDFDSDLWFVHQFMGVDHTFGSAVGFNQVANWYDIDSKAMRVVSEDERLVLVVENGHASQGAQFWHSMRILSTQSAK